WSEIWKSGVDYNTGFLVQRPGLTIRESPSYDKYGRIFAALAADYSLTPALTFHVITNVSWTDTAVDTKGTTATATGLTPSGITTAGNPFQGGKERYLGNEWVGGLTYRFAPNVVLELAAAALLAGEVERVAERGPGDPVPPVRRLRPTLGIEASHRQRGDRQRRREQQVVALEERAHGVPVSDLAAAHLDVIDEAVREPVLDGPD